MDADSHDGEVRLGAAGSGRLREFWTGFLLAVVTFTLYEVWWYYRLNDELRAVGRLLDDAKLARSLPLVSASALAIGLFTTFPGRVLSTPLAIAVLLLFLLSLVSQHRFGLRIRRAEALIGLPEPERFKRWAVLLLFPGSLFLFPYFFWFAYVTRHQNELLVLAADLPQAHAPLAAQAS